ncbi:MAG: HDOD domain-containing protein [Nitrosomonadales bacterium]|nr:HDOD domain-containing protein [Nitrosomonadales bacterium]
MPQFDQSIRDRLLVARLPAMPQILFKLIGLCQKDEAGMAELAKLIANDAGMTAKILATANNAAYNRSGHKVDLSQSLNTLGTEMIKTLVISESVLQAFSGFSQVPGIDLGCFLAHALKAAVLSRELAKKMSYAQVEEAYLAGLLHDVGRLALLSAAPQEYSANFMTRDDENLCEIETRSLAITHTEAGAWLIEKWNLDSFVADSVLYHHESVSRLRGTHPLIRIVHVAHLLSTPSIEDAVLEVAANLCEIDVATLRNMRDAAVGQARAAAAHLGIDLSAIDRELPPASLDTPRPVINVAPTGLADEVANVALVSTAGQTFARKRSDRELLESIVSTTRILFKFSDLALLLHSANSQSLVGIPIGEHQGRLGEITVPLSSGGLIAESALKRQVMFSDRGSTPSLLDEQLRRFIGAECLVCLPLTSGRRCFGVLAGGVTAIQAEELRNRARLLQSFANQAAASLEAAANARSEVDKRIASVNAEHLEVSRRVAHEVNNPLSIIKNYLSILDEKLSRQEPVKEEISILNEEIDRVGRIVGGLIEKPAQVAEKRAEINSIVNEVVRLFRTSRYLPAAVSLVVSTPDMPAEMAGPADTLKQILLNLIKNAVEALPNGGRIEIRNHGCVIRDGRAYFQLSVSDNGRGIPAEVMAHLFAPVRSSKSGANRGLGLSIVHGLVTRLNGKIECRSEESGTVFEILLPAIDNAASAVGEPERIAYRM